MGKREKRLCQRGIYLRQFARNANCLDEKVEATLMIGDDGRICLIVFKSLLRRLQ
jgi:hypothetical protein